MPTKITQQEAKNKYGILVNQPSSRGLKYYLQDNGIVLDSLGDTRYIPKEKDLSIPLSLELKPTKVSQTCPSCNKPLQKGDPRLSAITGAFGNSLKYSYWHATCFQQELNALLKLNS